MSILGGIVGGALGLIGSDRAADAQAESAQAALDLNRQIYRQTSRRLAPYAQAGSNALQAYLYEMGLGDAPTIGGYTPQITKVAVEGTGRTYDPMASRTGGGMLGNVRPDLYGKQTVDQQYQYQVGGQTFGSMAEAQAYADSIAEEGQQYGGISMSPNALFRLQQGRDEIEAGAAASGGLFSGATLQGLEDYRQNVATADRDNQLNRLLGLVQGGQSAATGQGSAGINFANAGTQLMTGAGNARAAGIVGGVNALTGAIDNIVGYQQYNRQLAPSTANYSGGSSLGPDWASGWF